MILKFKSIELEFETPNSLEFIVEKARQLNSLANFFQFEKESFEILKNEIALSRVKYDMPSEMFLKSEQRLIELFTGLENPLHNEEIKAINIRNIINKALIIDDEFQLSHTIISLQNELLDEIEIPVSKTSHINGLLDDILTELNLFILDKDTHPLLKVWIVYFLLETLEPLNYENELVSRQFVYKYLESQGFGFFNLLKLEQYVFHQNKYKSWKINSSNEKISLNELLHQNINAFLEICLEGFAELLQWIELTYHNAIKDTFDYSEADLYKSNRIDFFLEALFPQKTSLIESNVFNSEIIYQIFEKGVISQKEINSLFSKQYSSEELEENLSSLIEKGIIKIDENIDNQLSNIYIFNYRLTTETQELDAFSLI